MQGTLVVESLRVLQGAAGLVVFDRDGRLITADDRSVVRWGDTAPGPRVDLARWKPLSGLDVADDGTVLVGAARVAPDGTVLGDRAAFKAFGAGNSVMGDSYRLAGAGWTPDGAELWVSLEKLIPRAPRGEPAEEPEGPSVRYLVLDAQLRLVREPAGPGLTAWQKVLATDRWIVLSGGGLAAQSRSDPGRVVELVRAGASAFALAPGRRFLVAVETGAVHVWRTDDWTEVARWDAGQPLASPVAVSADGGLVAVGDPSGAVEVWRLDAGAAARAGQAPSRGRQLTALAFSPDGARLATASPEGPGWIELFALRAR